MFPEGAHHEVGRLRAMLGAARGRAAFRATAQTPEFYINAYRSYCSRRGSATEGERAAVRAVQSRLARPSEAASARPSKL